tara:strand:- start:774 stop:1337 length:564 start_codon:yes stop_codon:yes gene_type:complete
MAFPISMPRASTFQRAREHTIRDAMGLPQRFTLPEGISDVKVSDLDEFKASASNIRGYMERTRNPLISGMDLDFGEQKAPETSPAYSMFAKGPANAGQPAPVGYSPMTQGYSRELLNSIAGAEARTLSKYRESNPETATLNIFSIGADSIIGGKQGISRPKIGAPTRGIEIGQQTQVGVGVKNLLGE